MKEPRIYSGLAKELGHCNFCTRFHTVVIVMESAKPGGCQVRFCRRCRRLLKQWIEPEW